MVVVADGMDWKETKLTVIRLRHAHPEPALTTVREIIILLSNILQKIYRILLADMQSIQQS